MKFGNKQYSCGVEFTHDFLKLVILQQTAEKREVVFVESIVIRNLSDDQIFDALSIALKPIRRKIGEAFLFLPVNSAIIKTIQIPSVDDREIRDILNLQAGRQTPYAREELVMDYLSLGQHQGVYTKALVIMVTSEYIKHKLALLEAVNVRVSKVIFNAEGMGVFGKGLLNSANEEETGAIIALDDEFSDFYIFGAKGIVFARNIPLGMNQFQQDKEKSAARFSDEVKRSVEAYQSEDIAAVPEQLFVSLNGDPAQLIEQGAFAQTGLNAQALNLKDIVTIGEPWNKLLQTPTQPGYLGIIANLCFSEQTTVNMLPDDIKLQRQFEGKARKLVTAGILFMVIFFQVCLIFVLKMYYKEKYLNDLQAKFRAKVVEAEELGLLSEKTRTLKNYLADRASSINVIARLYDMLPDEIYLRGISVTKDNKVLIKGTSKSMSRIFAFVTELENDPLFRGVKTNSTESRKENGEDVSDFAISMSVVILQGEDNG